MTWFLLGLVVFEFFFALDCFKKKKYCEEFAITVANGAAKTAREQDAKIADMRKSLEYRVKECDYLRGLLDQHGIEWEEGWRKL